MAAKQSLEKLLNAERKITKELKEKLESKGENEDQENLIKMLQQKVKILEQTQESVIESQPSIIQSPPQKYDIDDYAWNNIFYSFFQKT